MYQNTPVDRVFILQNPIHVCLLNVVEAPQETRPQSEHGKDESQCSFDLASFVHCGLPYLLTP